MAARRKKIGAVMLISAIRSAGYEDSGQLLSSSTRASGYIQVEKM